jgi:AcrR family transcriptional regulator
MGWKSMVEGTTKGTKKRRGEEVSTAAKAIPPARRRRLKPEDREREILDGAVAFFAELGFDGGLRDLAKRLGITHQNLFRYFPTKEALIERVYEEVYLSRWQPEWETILQDTSRPLDQRLIEFYEAYLPAIFRYDWVRIFVFAGLRGVDISQRYLDLIQEKVVEPVGLELSRVAGIAEEPTRVLSAAELEIAWSLHGELFYLAIRRWVYGMKTPDDLGPIIRAAVVRFLKGAPAAMRALNCPGWAASSPIRSAASRSRRETSG